MKLLAINLLTEVECSDHSIRVCLMRLLLALRSVVTSCISKWLSCPHALLDTPSQALERESFFRELAII